MGLLVQKNTSSQLLLMKIKFYMSAKPLLFLSYFVLYSTYYF